ncbi:Na+/H+ antiporter subunit C [Paracoccus sp. (in: a-proteobacteria)]|uniref:Na+/H+ antiporter subunit C n=1 Tax=Paracoccus sp. TaxID=267 RepID=UPI0026DF7C2D|nr:Na+/H+ antiporter subunit C [Paracoccus sp. (in: a-proteobacteria)]MDO5370758.1 Na+/H+ antiporter subunit C [Paracoccus sp. (in: a-proteobacteria)]
MEFLIASAIGTLTAAGVYLTLRKRSFAVIVGMTLLSYATNLFLFSTGRLVIDRPPILNDAATGYTDPLPQALVLTAIVISFGMTAVTLMMALGAFIEGGDDHIDLPGRDRKGPRA